MTTLVTSGNNLLTVENASAMGLLAYTLPETEWTGMGMTWTLEDDGESSDSSLQTPWLRPEGSYAPQPTPSLSPNQDRTWFSIMKDTLAKTYADNYVIVHNRQIVEADVVADRALARFLFKRGTDARFFIGYVGNEPHAEFSPR